MYTSKKRFPAVIGRIRQSRYACDDVIHSIIRKHLFILFVSGIMIMTALSGVTFAQAECTAWGNLRGIRIDGHLMKFETSLCVVNRNWFEITQTAKERQRQRYNRDGSRQTISTNLDDISLVEVVEDIERGLVSIDIQATSQADTSIIGAFLCIEFPEAKIQLIDSTASAIDRPATSPRFRFGRRSRNIQASVRGVRFISPHQQLEVSVAEPTELYIQRGNRFMGAPHDRVLLGVLFGELQKGQKAQKTFKLKVTGDIDKNPVQLSVDPRNPGRVFDGIGGNFRLQSPEADPQVIDYCLKNLNVTWGRVEMPWRNWHRDENRDPIAEAEAGNLDDGVREAMEMARRLARMNIPVIVSAWYPPGWAVIGETGFRQQGGLRGNPLNPEKMKSIIKSIGAYLIYLKQAYGVEAAMFSFNESDLGINVRQTGQEHADLIKRLGVYFASQGLATKMLLGDNSDANTYFFLEPAMEDPETHKYIGAISFHSWRGCDAWTLSMWADAANTMNVPLLVCEASTDAAAHRYPDIFLEPSYSLDEIDTYLRICAICQPRAILQWQLTSDYSVLSGDGIYNTKGPLRPTQRFWNLKQLGLTPSGSFHLPVTCDRPDVTCTAFGDLADGVYTVHIVNSGAERQATLSGLAVSVGELRMYVTDHNRGMEEGKRIRLSGGRARFTLDATSFTTLIGP